MEMLILILGIHQLDSQIMDQMEERMMVELTVSDWVLMLELDLGRLLALLTKLHLGLSLVLVLAQMMVFCSEES